MKKMTICSKCTTHSPCFFHKWNKKLGNVMDRLQILLLMIRIHWRLLTILKTNKKVCELMFFYIWKYVYSESTQYTKHWDKTQILKKILSDKINSTKNALILLSKAPTHHSFTFNLRFLYELKHKVRLSKTMCEIFHFRFHPIFIKVYTFVQQNALTLWL